MTPATPGRGSARLQGLARAAALVLPGLGWILRGRVVAGLAVASWVALTATAAVLGTAHLGGDAARRGPDVAAAWAAVACAAVAAWAAAWLHTRSLERPSAAASPAVAAWRRLRRRRLAMVGLWIIGLLYLAMLTAPLLAPYAPEAQLDVVHNSLQPPSIAHPLGTDRFARDVLSRVLYGARVSLSIGVLAAGLAVTVGAVIGAVAGYLGRWVDGALMRLVDMMMAFPRLVLLLALLALVETRSLWLVVAVLGLTGWMDVARLVRGQVLSLREREFVLAARALGLGTPRIIARHLLPNAAAPVLVSAALMVGNTILVEAGLSFLGLGVPPPTPTWGTMVEEGRSYLLDAPWITAAPGLAIVAAVVSINLLGDGLRDALDPRGS